MKLIEQNYKILEQPKSLDDAKKIAEYAGRQCYHSVDKITDNSYESFVNNLIEHKHYSPLEHATIYLKFPLHERDVLGVVSGKRIFGGYKFEKYNENEYSKASFYEYHAYVTTNLRVILEHKWEDDLKYICEPTEFHEKRISVHLTTNRQVANEIVRHRKFSFAQESTRFCNYCSNKFGNEIVFIKPCWLVEDDNDNAKDGRNAFLSALFNIEDMYFRCIKQGWKPQQAATLLPNATKTELIVTGFESDWKHFFDLRYFEKTGKVHPQMMEITKPLYEEFVKSGFAI